MQQLACRSQRPKFVAPQPVCVKVTASFLCVLYFTVSAGPLCFVSARQIGDFFPARGLLSAFVGDALRTRRLGAKSFSNGSATWRNWIYQSGGSCSTYVAMWWSISDSFYLIIHAFRNLSNVSHQRFLSSKSNVSKVILQQFHKESDMLFLHVEV